MVEHAPGHQEPLPRESFLGQDAPQDSPVHRVVGRLDVQVRHDRPGL